MRTKHWTHSSLNNTWNFAFSFWIFSPFVDYVMLTWDVLQAMKSWAGPGNKAIAILVSRGQTLFCTEGKGLGHSHRAVCRPAPWSVYQSQHSIQSHDTWSMWLTGKFEISVWVECGLEAWEVRWAKSVLSHELEHSRNQNRGCRKVKSYVGDCHCNIMTGFTWLIKFLGGKLLYGHVPDPFPRCINTP